MAIDIRPKDRAWTEEELRALLEKMIPPYKPPKTKEVGSETLNNFLRRNYEARVEYRKQAIEDLLIKMMKSPEGNNFWAHIIEDLEEEQKQK